MINTELNEIFEIYVPKKLPNRAAFIRRIEMVQDEERRKARYEELYNVTPATLAKHFALTISQLKKNYGIWLDQYLKDRLGVLQSGETK